PDCSAPARAQYLHFPVRHLTPYEPMSVPARIRGGASGPLWGNIRWSRVPALKVLVELGLQDPEHFQEDVAARVPLVGGISPPLRMKAHALEAPVNAGVEAGRAKAPDVRPSPR